MQTCRQVHAEFAEILYSDPIEISAPSGINILSVSVTYASLLRSVLVLLPWKSLDTMESERSQLSPMKFWTEAVQIANGVSKIFPSLKTLRFGWRIPVPVILDPEVRQDWALFDGRLEGSREWHVKEIEQTLRRVHREIGCSPTVPHQFELVQLDIEGKNVVTPFTEAARNLRRKPPVKR